MAGCFAMVCTVVCYCVFAHAFVVCCGCAVMFAACFFVYRG